MTRAYSGLGNRSTPQSEAIPGSAQTPNSAGGFTWTVDSWTRLDRFLVLGSEGGTFYIGERDLSRENAGVILECLSLDGPRTVRRIVEISDTGRAARNTPAIFALAVACSSTDPTTKRDALDAIPFVCRTGTHIFQFATLVSDFRGWGRSLRRGIGAWYTQDPAKLAYQAIKYRQREGWTHKDLLRLAHPARQVSSGNPTVEGVTPLHERVFNWIVRREALGELEGHGIDVTEGHNAERIIGAFERSMAAKTPKETAALVQEYGGMLPREALQPEHLNTEVWAAMVDVGMPITALLRNLANLTRKGVLGPLGDHTRMVCDALRNADLLRQGRVHPYAVLLASRTYATGGRVGMSQGDPYQPVSAVLDALDEAFYTSFGDVVPTGKRIMLALDVSGSMGHPILGTYQKGHLVGVPITAREGAAAMALITRHVESDCMTVAFADGGWVYRRQSAVHPYGGLVDGINEIDLSDRRSLGDVLSMVTQMRMGGTDCALPMLYANANSISVDTFVIYTDSETWAGSPHPSQALRAYREKTGINAKLVVVGMASNGFSIADPNDPGMLDAVGFDASTPNVISQFTQG